MLLGRLNVSCAFSDYQYMMGLLQCDIIISQRLPVVKEINSLGERRNPENFTGPSQ
jgi:hypothetical protein